MYVCVVYEGLSDHTHASDQYLHIVLQYYTVCKVMLESLLI